MRSKYLAALVLVVLITSNVAAVSASRTINDIPAARESLRTMVSPKFYRSLLISPVEARVVVRGTLARDHLVGPKVIHSELNGRYDALALELATNLKILNYTQPDTSASSRRVLVHLLIYQIADGKVALSFAHLEEPGGSQFRYSGAAWMAVLKGGQWVALHPSGLSPHERPGPRTYTLAIEAPGSLRSLYGNGRPPIATLSVQGSQDAPTHTAYSR
jgi:hypothetical protein